MIGAQSDSIGMDASSSEPVAGDESKGPATQVSQEVKLVFGSIAAGCAASVAGSIHPSSDGTICSELIPGAAQVRSPEHYPMVDLSHAHRDCSALLT